MEKCEIKKNKQRISFSKKLKYKILTEITKGTSAKEAFLKYVPLSLNELSRDEKYISKLVHKWKKEALQNNKFLNPIHYNFDSEIMDEQIKNFPINDKNFNIEEAINDLKQYFLKIL